MSGKNIMDIVETTDIAGRRHCGCWHHISVDPPEVVRCKTTPTRVLVCTVKGAEGARVAFCEEHALDALAAGTHENDPSIGVVIAGTWVPLDAGEDE